MVGDYWIDCDFAAESKRVGRELGCLHPPATYTSGRFCPIFEEQFRERIVPQSEWQSLYDELKPDQSRLVTSIYDQNGYGTCTSNAAAQAIAVQWARKYGTQWAITPAPPSLYPFCASSGNSGSSVSCIVQRAMDYGVLLCDTPQNRKVLRTLDLNENHVIDAVQWNAGKRCPQEWYEETAIHFRLLEAYEITSVGGMISAAMLGFSVHAGRDGHSIVYIDPDERNNWSLIYPNSWGHWGETRHGLQGYGVDSTSYLSRSGAYRGAIAYRTISEPPNVERLLEAADD